MPYPEDPLPVSVEIYLGESLGWVDITDYVLVRDGGIYIRRGFGDEAIRPEPSSATFTLNNKDGRFSPRNVLGPYYGLIGRNTPVRISVGLFVDQFGTAFSDGWANDWTLVTTGGATSDFDVSSGVGAIVVDGAPEVRAAFVSNRSFRDIEVRATVDINDTDISGGAVATGPMLRVTDEDDHYWCAIRVGTDESVTVAIVDRSSGTDTDLDSEATGITWDGTPLRVAFQAYRTTLRAKVWLTGEPEPADWTIEVTDTAHSSGSVGVRVATMSGNTDTPLTFVYDEFEARSYRFHGEISEWPPRWDLSGQDVWVPVTAQGVFRRLQQGNRPARSPFTSAILSANTNRPSVAGTLVAYWPMEDGIDGQAFLPAVPGVEPLRYSGTAPDLAAAGPALGSDRIPVLASDTRLSAAVPAAASGEFLVFCVVDFPPTIGWADGTPLLRVNQAVSSGGVATWEVRYRTLGGGSLELRTLNTSGTVIATATDLAAIADVVQALLILRPNAPILGDALLVIYEDDDGNLNLDFAFGGDLGAPTYVTSIEIAPTGGLADLGVGQVGVSSDADFLTAIGFTDTGTGLLAFDGETAADRAERLAGDAGVSFTLIGDASDTEPLGRQAIPAKLMDALDETWRADMALLFESRHELGLTFRTRASMYNQDAGLTLAYTARGEIAPDLEPVDDDQKVRNDITVKRKDGSSTRAVDTTSRLSVKPPPDGVGAYDEQVEINLHGDHQLPNQASWRLHLGTWDEARFPRVVVDFAALMAAGKPGLVADACALDVGDRATLTDLPVYSGALDGMADLMALGMAEQIGHPVEWRAVFNCAPYGPWQVGVYAADDATSADNPSRYQARGCVTRADFDTAADSTLLVDTPEGGFTDNPDALPYRIRCAGVVFEVTAVSAPGATQDLTVTVLNGVNKVIPAGSPVEIHYESYYAL